MRWSNLENDSFECLWLYLRPKRLPRPLSGIVIAVIYHPPCLPVKEHDDLNEYLINTADLIRNKYPDHGLVFVGDFNDFETGTLMSTLNVKQVVDKPTRGGYYYQLAPFIPKSPNSCSVNWVQVIIILSTRIHLTIEQMKKNLKSNLLNN